MEDDSDRTDFGFDVFDRFRNPAGIGNIEGEILKGNSAGRETSEVFIQRGVKVWLRPSQQYNFAAALPREMQGAFRSNAFSTSGRQQDIPGAERLWDVVFEERQRT